MPAVRLSFQYQPGEYALALRRVQARRLHPLRDVVAAALALALAAAWWSVAGFTVWLALLAAAAGALLLMLTAALFLVPALAERSNPKIRDPYDLHFSEEGIHFRTTNIDSKLAWSLYSS